MRKRTQYMLGAGATYAAVALFLRFAGSGVGWGAALLFALVATPLVFWAAWLRGRMREQAAEWGRRRFRPWPEERRR